MVGLTLSAALCDLLPPGGPVGRALSRLILTEANSWPEAVAEIRRNYPALAERVLTPTGAVKRGFLVAVNDSVDPTNGIVAEVRSGDELFLFVQIAGG